jgi:hypothetical protein
MLKIPLIILIREQLGGTGMIDFGLQGGREVFGA